MHSMARRSSSAWKHVCWCKNEICLPLIRLVSAKKASMWTPLTSHDCNGIVLIVYALDGSEEFGCVETRVLV